MVLETMAQKFFHYVSYNALLMESVNWIVGFKKVVMAFYPTRR